MNPLDTTPLTIPEDMKRSKAWTAANFGNPADLPISFDLDGETSHGIPAAWQPTIQRRRIDANLIETIFEGTDPHTGLTVRVELTEYQDFPVVEWVAWLSNAGSTPTPMIHDILALAACRREGSTVQAGMVID